MLTLNDYMSLRYAIEIKPDECGDTPCYMAYHPELRGCMAQGDTPEEALANLIEARSEYIALLLSRGVAAPLPSMHKVA